MLLRELTYTTTEQIDPEIAKASLAVLQGIDTSSSQWRKTKSGSIKTQELEDVQFILKQLGYNPGRPDGWFGKKTARAVMQFQKDNNLKVDGDPGKNTINKMIDVVGDKFFDDEDGDITATYLDKDGKDTGIPAELGKAGGTDFELDKLKYMAQQAIGAAEDLEERQVWARSGNKVVRKYRCTSGARKGRVVKEPAQCFRAKDIKKRMKMKQLKAKMGARMARKAKRTKRVNPASRRVQAMNRSSR